MLDGAPLGKPTGYRRRSDSVRTVSYTHFCFFLNEGPEKAAGGSEGNGSATAAERVLLLLSTGISRTRQIAWIGRIVTVTRCSYSQQ